MDPPVSSFEILTVGRQCAIAVTGQGDRFRPDVGGSCTLVFPGGPRTLRVTDAIARYGQTGGTYFTGRSYIDPSVIQVDLGGDDVATGRHVLYRFSGRASDGPDLSAICPAYRPEHDRYAAVTEAQ